MSPRAWLAPACVAISISLCGVEAATGASLGSSGTTIAPAHHYRTSNHLNPPPPPAAGLTVSGITGTSATISWTAGTSPEFRAIYKAGSLPVNTTDGTLITEGTATSATPAGLAPITRYFIAVYGKASGSATYSATAISTSFITGPTALITPNGFGGAPWDRRGSPTRQGKFIFGTDTGDLNFFNGSAITTIQSKGAFTTNPNTVFILGTAASPAQVIAGWRRDDAYLSVDGGSPVMINATNPVNANHMDAEVIAIDSGYVFAVFRAPVGQSEVRNAFLVDPTTGNATNISNNTTVYGVTHMSSSGNKAAWTFDDGTGQSSLKLQYYNGSTASTIDSGIFGDPSISQGRIVYAKIVAPGRSEIYLYDTNLASPSPVPLTNDATKTNEKPFTDGRHAAWIRKNADGTGAEIMLNGLVQVTSGNFALLDNTVAPPFDLDRGQMLWRDTTLALHHLTSFSEEIVDPSTAVNRAIPWLADGRVVFFDSTVAPSPIYLFTGRLPNDTQQPSAPMTLSATPGVGSVTLKWDAILGATSYNVYYANVPGVTKANYASLTGGTRITGVTSSSFQVNGLASGAAYYFAITTVGPTGEGPESRQASAVLIGTPSWSSIASLGTTAMDTTAVDRTNANTAYAAGANNTYVSIDGGVTWTLLAGLAGQNVRALAADGGQAFATTRSGPIFKSTNSGTSWTPILLSASQGDLNQAIAIDPAVSNTVLAGDFRLPTFTGSANDSDIIRSDDGGATWFHTPQSQIGASLVAYAMAFDPNKTPNFFIGGNGTPNVATSIAGGAGWTDIPTANGSVYAIAIDPRNSQIVYAGIAQSASNQGVWKSVNGGATWTQLTTLPAGTAVRAILVDPADSNVIHVGSDTGYFYSTNGGSAWTAANTGLPVAAQFIKSLAVTGAHRLVAATAAGLYVINPSVPALPAPTNVVAAATSATQVGITWSAVNGATSYEVYRRVTGSNTLDPLSSPATNAYNDNGVTGGHSYLYVVRAVNASTSSPDSAPDLATTIFFTNDPLVASSTPVKYTHLSEIRDAVNAVRLLAGVGSMSFSAAAAGTAITAAQVNEVRTALDAGLGPLGLPTGGYTDTVAIGTAIKAIHFQQPRNRTK